MIKRKLFILLAPLWAYATTPAAPTNLILTPSSHAVVLEWTDNANDEEGYEIFRDDELIAIVPPNVESYHDSMLVASKNYNYTVRAKGLISGNASDALETRIQGILEGRGGLRSVVVSPLGYGAVVEYGWRLGAYIELWGLEDPNNPTHEHLIDMDDVMQTQYENIKMLGGGKISYTHTILTPDNDIMTFKVVYDYVAKVKVSTTITSIALESALGNAVDKLYRDTYHVTPTHIQVTNTKKLDKYLYAAEVFVDAQNWFDARYGKVMYDTRDNISYEISHAQEGSGGTQALNILVNKQYHCFSYTETNSFDDVGYSVVYDYKTRHELSKVQHDTKTEQEILYYLSAKYGTHPYHHYKVLTSEAIENGLFLVTYSYWNVADDFQRTEIFHTSPATSSSAQLYATLAHIMYGPGGFEAHNIMIDRANDVISYTTPMSNEWIQAGMSYNHYNMNVNILIDFNYATQTFAIQLPRAGGGYDVIHSLI